MDRLNPRLITDADGKRLAVVLDIDVFERLLEELDDAEDSRLYWEAKADRDEVIPYDQAIEEIERKRQRV